MAEKSRVYQRYQWLIDLIQRSDGITFEEIDKAWRRSSMNANPYSPLSERTFHRHKNDIEEIFGITIRCHRDSNRYYIDNEGEVDAGGVQDWMLSTIAVGNMLNESRDLRDRIQFEEIPGGRQFLSVVINAMRENKVLHMVYQSFWSDEKQDTWLQPYFLKVFQQRWYVIGIPGTHPKEIRTFALDRMEILEPTREKFRYPRGFKPNEFFRDSFGIFHEDGPAVKVVLKVVSHQVKYFDSLPLHKSQRKMTEISDDKFTYYEYRMSPAYDLIQHICSKGCMVEVIQPQSLRDEVKTEAENMYKMYNK